MTESRPEAAFCDLHAGRRHVVTQACESPRTPPFDQILIDDKQKRVAVIQIPLAHRPSLLARKRNPVAANWNPAARRQIPVAVD
jgi:hypothetical protein